MYHDILVTLFANHQNGVNKQRHSIFYNNFDVYNI